ncbi:hypothetical protein H2200_009854 [Cladophialophora chaetospira]|uniref:P-loop containing nucleoside triphosphate hydrolase protein n=1 Tax=Cladophialophora chaetospira TaxID=386627 RepID=A0AA39CEY3_9EURO|nr:hypothetical protein H2200_009854 [Cladophialophora chaetospira]
MSDSLSPERMSVRYEGEEEARNATGYGESTYKTVFDHLEEEESKGKRVFIKDILHYLVPPKQQPPKLAPSLSQRKRGIGTENGTNGVNGSNGDVHLNGTNGVNGSNKSAPFPFSTEGERSNPTIVPKALLEKFHFTFLIRDPHSSIPSYYRCTIPPLEDMTGFHEFYPDEAGYDELRRFFDYARESGLVRDKHTKLQNGTTNGDATNGHTDVPEVCLVDADDLLDDPEGIIRAYCKSVGLDFHPDMLNWDNDELQSEAKTVFEKWRGFHEDAIHSTDLKPRKHVSTSQIRDSVAKLILKQKKAAKTEEQWDAEWKEKYGEKAASVIRKTVDQNMPDFLYLKQFALKAEA